MSYYNYYQKKEKKSEALEHFRKMDILMKDEIRQSVKETKIYGGNGLPVPDTEKRDLAQQFPILQWNRWILSLPYSCTNRGKLLYLTLQATKNREADFWKVLLPRKNACAMRLRCTIFSYTILNSILGTADTKTTPCTQTGRFTARTLSSLTTEILLLLRGN